jgi:hypothetical protein
VTARRFPLPWTVEEHNQACFIVRDNARWRNPPCALVIRRFLEFEGIGAKIATMATNILVRQFNVPMLNKSAIDISADRQVMKYFQSHGLLREAAKKEELIYLAREINPEYPGLLDLLAWEQGRQIPPKPYRRQREVAILSHAGAKSGP